jgi:hypothetical protein
MSAHEVDLIHGYLDETLTAEEHVELSNWIKASPDQAWQFSQLVLLHDRLRAEMLIDAGWEAQKSVTVSVRSSKHRWSARIFALSSALCLMLILGGIIWQTASSPVLAIADELQRIIQASEAALDRTYVLTALAANDDSQALPSHVRGSKPTVDGAVLQVRGPNQYVLTRYFADGAKFITGSDGQTAWAVPPRGRVRVSQDVTRFRGAVPGQQHSIPFIDMRNSLHQLQASYELELSPEVTPEGWRRIRGTRRTPASGGPKQVTLWYAVPAGTIHRMLLERLPQARGGPRTVLLELTDEADLGPAYFAHTSHHDENREVVEE